MATSEFHVVANGGRSSRQRLNVDQTIRGVNGESNEVPFTTSIVVVLATSPAGVPGNAICAEPDTVEAHDPRELIETAVLPFPGILRVVVPHTAPVGP